MKRKKWNQKYARCRPGCPECAWAEELAEGLGLKTDVASDVAHYESGGGGKTGN